MLLGWVSYIFSWPLWTREPTRPHTHTHWRDHPSLPITGDGGFPKKARLQDEIGVTVNLEACGEGHEVMEYIVVHKTTGDCCLSIAMALVTKPCAVAF